MVWPASDISITVVFLTLKIVLTSRVLVLESPVVDEERMRSGHWLGSVFPLTLLVGWQEGHLACKILCHLSPKLPFKNNNNNDSLFNGPLLCHSMGGWSSTRKRKSISPYLCWYYSVSLINFFHLMTGPAVFPQPLFDGFLWTASRSYTLHFIVCAFFSSSHLRTNGERKPKANWLMQDNLWLGWKLDLQEKILLIWFLLLFTNQA